MKKNMYSHDELEELLEDLEGKIRRERTKKNEAEEEILILEKIHTVVVKAQERKCDSGKHDWKKCKSFHNGESALFDWQLRCTKCSARRWMPKEGEKVYYKAY